MEAKLLGKNLNITSLPNKVLVCIFSHLNTVDKRACRMVCERWNSCCEERIITQTEKFVFHSPYQSAEINEFLVNIERRRINVHFIGNIDLATLDFEKFGRKIEELDITNCLFLDEYILKKLFLTTPNMTRFRVDVSRRSFNQETPRKVIKLLHEEKFSNTNLEEFHCCNYEGLIDMISISHLFSIFPHVKSVTFPDNVFILSLMDDKLRNVLPMTNITRICGWCLLETDDDDLNQSESFAQDAHLSKLEFLKFIIIDLPQLFNLCVKLFSQMTELEKLRVHITFPEDELFEDSVAQYEQLGKMLLFQILTSCPKLRQLSFKWVPSDGDPEMTDALEICLNSRDEVQHFCSLISKMHKLSLPVIRVELDLENPNVTMSDVNGFLKKLVIKTESCDDALDLRYMLINKCRQLTTLDLITGGEVLCANRYPNITEILQTQKYLQCLKIRIIRRFDYKCSEMDLDQVTPAMHHRLKYLKIEFWTSKFYHTLRVLITWLSTWEFPDLKNFELLIDYVNTRQPASNELRKFYREWFGKLLTLTHISIGVSFLNFGDCEQICSPMLHLEKIYWTFQEDPEPQKIMNLFKKLSNLRFFVLTTPDNQGQPVAVPMKYKSVEFFYCRSKKQLFKRHYDKFCEGLNPFELVNF